MKLRQYIREMVETELNEMAAIATLEKIKSPEKLEKFKKLYTGNENSLVSKLIDTIEKGSVKVADAEKAASNPKAQEVIEFIKGFNSKPGFREHPIPVTVLTKEFGSIDDLVSDGILSKVEGATRNGMLVATNKSHTAGISPILRDLSRAGVLSDPKAEGEYITPKKEKPEPSGIKGRPTSEKVLVAKALASKFEADSDYEPNEEELAMFADKPDFIERLRDKVNGTLKRGPKNALKNAMKGLETLGDDIDGDGDVDNEDIMENESNETGIPLTSEVKAYVDSSLAELKASEDFEYLKDVGFFETEFEENTLLKFEDQYPNADNVSKELRDYIQTEVYGDSNLNENKNMMLDTNKLKSFISRIKSFGGSKYDRQDFVQIAKLLVGNKLSEAAKMISLLDTSPNEWIFEAMSETYPELWDMLFEDDKSGYVALAKPRTGLSESKKSKNKKPLNEQFLRMQKLAGLITESQLNENELSQIETSIQQEYPEIVNSGEIEQGTEEWLFLLQLAYKVYGLNIANEYDISKAIDGKGPYAQQVKDLGSSPISDLETALENLGVNII